jgi:hypothetical protein
MNNMEFNRNEFNEIVGGGIPLNRIIGEYNNMAEQLGGGIRTIDMALNGLVVPIGLDSHIVMDNTTCGSSVTKRKETQVVLEELFDSLFDRVVQKENTKKKKTNVSNKKRTMKKK